MLEKQIIMTLLCYLFGKISFVVQQLLFSLDTKRKCESKQDAVEDDTEEKLEDTSNNKENTRTQILAAELSTFVEMCSYVAVCSCSITVQRIVHYYYYAQASIHSI